MPEREQTNDSNKFIKKAFEDLAVGLQQHNLENFIAELNHAQKSMPQAQYIDMVRQLNSKIDSAQILPKVGIDIVAVDKTGKNLLLVDADTKTSFVVNTHCETIKVFNQGDPFNGLRSHLRVPTINELPQQQQRERDGEFGLLFHRPGTGPLGQPGRSNYYDCAPPQGPGCWTQREAPYGEPQRFRGPWQAPRPGDLNPLPQTVRNDDVVERNELGHVMSVDYKDKNLKTARVIRDMDESVVGLDDKYGTNWTRSAVNEHHWQKETQDGRKSNWDGDIIVEMSGDIVFKQRDSTRIDSADGHTQTFTGRGHRPPPARSMHFYK